MSPLSALAPLGGRSFRVEWDWSPVTGAGGFVRSFAVNAYTVNYSRLVNSAQLALDTDAFLMNSSLSGIPM